MSKKAWPVLVLFFISGFSGLMYQVLWMRQFKFLLGSSIVAVSTIVAVFMLGLLIGSYWIGKKLSRKSVNNELKLYGLLEMVIGLSGLLLLFLLPLSKPLFAAFGTPTMELNVVRLVYNVVLSFFLLLLPTAAMGATLPLLVNYFTKKVNRFRTITAHFYAFNALGGSVAAVITGFYLIRWIGVSNSLWMAVFLNLMIGAAAYLMSKNTKESLQETQDISSGEQESQITTFDKFILIASMVTGFISIGYEVLWIRCMNYLLNSSTYTFAIILGIFLFGIAAGSLLVAYLKNSLSRGSWIGVIQFLLSVFGIWIIHLFYEFAYSDQFAHLFIESNGLQSNWYESIGLNFIFALLVFLIPAILMGMSFPLISDLYYERVGEGAGAAISKIYVLNTLGCILGALLPVFVLIPLLGGIKNTLYLLAGLNLLLALAFVWFSHWKMRKLAAGLFLFVFVIFFFSFSSGNYLASLESIGEDRIVDKPLFYKEGIMATVKVYNKEGKYRSMSIDGVTIASESFKQKESIIGHLPFFTETNIKDVLVVGLASGSTIGSILKHDEVKQVDVVEIVPSVRNGADYFKEVNADVNQNPLVNIYIDDIYSFLSYSHSKYDLISSDGKFGVLNKSNTTMLSKDYYELCREHLAENGIFVQWISTKIPNAHLKTVFSTTASVFPYSELFLLRKNLFILSSNNPMPMNGESVKDALANNAVADDLYVSELFSAQKMLSSYIGPLKNFEGSSMINSFDRPLLEYNFVDEWKKDVLESRTSDFRNFKFLLDLYKRNAELIKQGENTVTNNAELVSYEGNLDFWNSRFHYFMANHSMLDGDKATAYKSFKEVVDLNHPSNSNDVAVSAKQIGVLYLDKKKYSQALRYFATAIDNIPGYSDAHTLKGVSLYYLNEKDSAKLSFERALELNPKDQTALQFMDTY